jgi:hypothetical protein
MEQGRYLLVNLWSVAFARSIRALLRLDDTFSFSVGSDSGSSSSSSELASISVVEGSSKLGLFPSSSSSKRILLLVPPLSFGVVASLVRFSEALGVLNGSGFRLRSAV